MKFSLLESKNVNSFANGLFGGVFEKSYNIFLKYLLKYYTFKTNSKLSVLFIISIWRDNSNLCMGVIFSKIVLKFN